MIVEIKHVKKNKARIIFEYFEPFEALRSNFSTLEKNFAYIKRCKSKNIRVQSSKEYIQKSCIKMNGEFEIGLLFDILLYCKNNFYNRVISFKFDDYIKNYIEYNKLNLNIDINGNNPRDYQINSMQIALNKQNGIFILGTGAGKTLCTALLVHNLLYHKLVNKILLICPFPDLANQTYNEISDCLQSYDYKISKWFEKHKFNFESNLIVAGSDIIRSQYELYQNELSQFDCIIIDEAHQLKLNNKITAILSELPAKFRYGFTGTLPSDKHDIWALKGIVGPLRYELPSVDLRKNNYLTEVNVLGIHVLLDNIPTTKINEDGTKSPFTFMDEVDWLSDNQQFNEIIVSITKFLTNNTLILINRIKHGEALFELYQRIFPDKQIFFIQGNVPIEERTEIKKIIEKDNNVIIIAQVATFSVGISLNNISNIIFPGLIGKSSVRVVQSIGRILRLHNNKKLAKVIDIIPNTKYCLKHIDIRKQIYEKEKITYIEKSLTTNKF